MTNMACLALIIAMEARNQNDYTKSLVADIAIERAKVENVSICSSMKKPKAYSWMWDGVNTKLTSDILMEATKIARKELKSPIVTGRYFFNECTLGRRYKTQYRMIRSEKLCFY